MMGDARSLYEWNEYQVRLSRFYFYNTLSSNEVSPADSITQMNAKITLLIFSIIFLASCTKDKEVAKPNLVAMPYSSSQYSEDSQGYEPTEHTTSVPVQVWKQCMTCIGSGQCPYCYGQGHCLSMYGDDQDCPVCTGGRCPGCAGQGGHYEVEYETRVDYY